MVKHIVMWKLKGDGAVRQENLQRAKAALETCRGIVPGMLTYEIGMDIGINPVSWDVGIYTEFTDRAALDDYQKHPTHEASKTVIGPLVESRGLLDYEV
jgi:quinol monooxygenase YgiN